MVASFRKKRGTATHESLWAIIELVLVLMILVSVFVYLLGIKDNSSFHKTYLVRDTALVVDALYAAHGSVVYTYVLDSHSFMLTYRDQRVYAKESDKDQGSFYWYADDEAYGRLDASLDNPSIILFTKDITPRQKSFGEE